MIRLIFADGYGFPTQPLEQHDNLLFVNKRPIEQRNQHQAQILESMRGLFPTKVSRDTLQKIVGIRRKSFIKELKALIRMGRVIVRGLGVKAAPYYYVLAPGYDDEGDDN